MTDPVTLTTVGAAALTGGVQFLYAQAGAILERWRQRSDHSAEEPLQPSPSQALEQSLKPTSLDWDVIERVAPDLASLRESIQAYVEQPESIDGGDQTVVQLADALRRVLEIALDQRITFAGEQREQAAATVNVRSEIDEVLGYSAGVRAKLISPGLSISVERKIGSVGPGATDVGVDLG